VDQEWANALAKSLPKSFKYVRKVTKMPASHKETLSEIFLPPTLSSHRAIRGAGSLSANETAARAYTQTVYC